MNAFPPEAGDQFAPGNEPMAQDGPAGSATATTPSIAAMLERARTQVRHDAEPVTGTPLVARVGDPVDFDFTAIMTQSLGTFGASAAHAPAPAGVDAPNAYRLPPVPAGSAIVGAPAADAMHPAVSVHAPQSALVIPAGATARGAEVVASPNQALLAEPGIEADTESLEYLQHLSLRDLAVESIRARLFKMAHPREPRSAQELVYLMLAFAMMVLVTAPPLVRLVSAIHGHPAG